MNENDLTELLRRNPDLQLVTDTTGYTTIRDARGRKGDEIISSFSSTGKLTEHALQAAIIAECDKRAATNPVWRRIFHPANGEYRTKATAGRLKAMGVKRGIPDLLLILPRHNYVGLVCEVKVSPNKPTAAQQDWLAWFALQGWFTAVVYDDPQEAIDILDWYINGA